MTSEDTLLRFWKAIDTADWEGVGALLSTDFHGHYPATGEHFDRAGFVRLNAEYPGRWHAEVLELVATEDRCVTRARVSDAHGGPESHQVASFATVRDGLITDVCEVWDEEGSTPPPDRRPT